MLHLNIYLRSNSEDHTMREEEKIQSYTEVNISLTSYKKINSTISVIKIIISRYIIFL